MSEYAGIAVRYAPEFPLGRSRLPYLQEISWDYPGYWDLYVIDLKTGRAKEVASRLQSTPRLSPGAEYVTWWERSDSSWYCHNISNGTRTNLTANLNINFYDEAHDWAYPADAYGRPLWLEDDAAVLIYDKYDIWQFDPDGKSAPKSLTNGYGRENDLRLRYVPLDPEKRSVPRKGELLLSAFNRETKDAGYYRINLGNAGDPTGLVLSSHRYTRPRKARHADRLMYTRESFTEFPNLWVADRKFAGATQLSDANPQQSEYLWGEAEHMRWYSVDGQELMGTLYKPANFNPDSQWPMIVYFYEKNSDNLNRHYTPAPHRSIINFSFYASRGYLIFVPDIPYKIGYPGESAMNAVIPGVTELLRRGYVDEDRIGIQGHSWGGYQIAYMITRTNMFRAAEAGAPVANMVSAYGGIRWETGLSRMFQYERTQSRIGGSLWEYPMRYIENSPIFWADKIETPLLIMHNDHDGHVPWYQGIELFVALRRLGKPSWLINYNDQPHWPVKFQNKVDWQKRLQQYFDHYLKDAPAPKWISEGVPALEKGKTLGYE